ncbi:TlpA family protein disulfide reductase [Agaribacter flavus]|uniref:TlpA family protein disulfide reductase n=1 Tax=Agaribacter flavus TaxID=1902781 RepID=A0ABV7FQA2_9ALTE
MQQRRFIPFLLASLLVLAFNFAGLKAHSQETANHTYMPEWTLYTEDGKKIQSLDYKGKPLILHFWATWCPFCKRLQPGLDALEKKYSDRGLKVLAVSLQEESGAKPQTELRARGLDLLTVVNGESLGIEQLNIQGTPTTIFVSPDGKILGSTMQSDPNDPKWESVAEYLVNLAADQNKE